MPPKRKGYWETETPREVTTTRNVLRWFPIAGKCQVSMPDWVDAEGEVKRGKTVTLDVRALGDQTVLDAFSAWLNGCGGQ
jgi:hypothetical protein